MESRLRKMKVQSFDSAIISTIPQSIIENILIRMPIRDAIRTSILSRNWRSYWKSMPKLVFDDKSVELPSNCKNLKKLKLVSAIVHVLIHHTGSILEFHLDVGELEMDSEFDQIICYLSRNNNLKTLTLNNSWRNLTMVIACNGDVVEFDVGLGSGVDRGYSDDGVGSDDG
ncbi:F-box/FBD/LRR-repeat protein-like protein [Tanacetum coccineum]|uniref:F-box/FBD/LRR-repeat protein-like protein n=1 Tax=Tanacetum coccineum TaxID=301880 RepID=A0ABQ4X0E0_9ASTR